MKVTFQATPNPATMKFNFNQKIADQSADFPNVEAAERSPLAAKVFGFPWTSSVFIGEDFVTITKQDWVDWDVLSAPLAGLLGEHIESGLPVLIDLIAANDESDTDSEIVKKIKRTLQTEIKPVVALDGDREHDEHGRAGDGQDRQQRDPLGEREGHGAAPPAAL